MSLRPDLAIIAANVAAGARVLDVGCGDGALMAALRSEKQVDARGLDGFDKRYLTLIAENFGGGPVGIETIAAALGEARDAIEEIVEPYLMQQGFVQRTPRGRLLTGQAYGHLGLAAPPRDPAQIGLFSGEEEA